MKKIIFILILFYSQTVFSDTTEEILLRIELQNILIIENNSQMFGFQFAYFSVFILILGYMAGRIK